MRFGVAARRIRVAMLSFWMSQALIVVMSLRELTEDGHPHHSVRQIKGRSRRSFRTRSFGAHVLQIVYN